MNFLGRNKELEELHNAWDEVKSGKGPRFVVIVAESGYGKTALVQEFYRRIALEENEPDGVGYWPDSLNRPAVATGTNAIFKNNLRINPELPQQWTPPHPIPWMWLGMRWANPADRNLTQSDGCALVHSSEYLEAHCQPALVARLKRSAAKESLLELGKSTIETVPFIGQICGTVWNWYELGKKLPKWGKVVAEKIKSPQEAHQENLFTIKDVALGYLRTFVDPGDKDLPTVPFILVLDDAQWADAHSLQFVHEAYDLCLKEGWPLFIVATFWEKHWRAGIDLPLPGNRHPQDWKHLRQTVNPGLIHELLLGRLPESRQILCDRYPKLGIEAETFILDQSDGNPLHLQEYLSLLDSEARRRSPWFVSKDPARALSKEGLEQLRIKSTRYEDLVRARLDQIFQESPSVIEVLKLAAVQGCSFYSDLVADVANLLGKQSAVIKLSEPAEQAIAKAQNPQAVVARASVATYEFRHYAYWKQLLNWLAESEQEEIKQALFDVVLDRVNSGRTEKIRAEASEFYGFALRVLLEPRHDPNMELLEKAVISALLHRCSYDHSLSICVIDLGMLSSLTLSAATFLSSIFKNTFIPEPLPESFSPEMSFFSVRDGGLFQLPTNLKDWLCKDIWRSEKILLKLEGLKELEGAVAAEIGNWFKEYNLGIGVEIDLSGLQHLKADVKFSELCCYALNLNGLRNLDKSQATSLREHFSSTDFGFLSLDGLEEICSEAAHELAEANLPHLTMNSLRNLAPETARKLVWLPETDEEFKSERWEFQKPISREFKSLVIDSEELGDWVCGMQMLGIEVEYKESKIDWFKSP